MPLDRDRKSDLRNRVSLANKANVDEVAADVNSALAELEDGDKDKARLEGWLEELSVVKGGGVPGKFS
jgi:predicted site-specific integrase-resolvase